MHLIFFLTAQNNREKVGKNLSFIICYSKCYFWRTLDKTMDLPNIGPNCYLPDVVYSKVTGLQWSVQSSSGVNRQHHRDINHIKIATLGTGQNPELGALERLIPPLTSISIIWSFAISADSRFAPSQWETSLQSNAISHWLCANLESALTIYTYIWVLDRYVWPLPMWKILYQNRKSHPLISTMGFPIFILNQPQIHNDLGENCCHLLCCA